jgi:hypothetical protein
VRHAPLPKRAATQLPPPDARRGKDGLDHPSRLAGETALEPQAVGASAEQALRRLREQSFARAVHEPQLPLLVEREHGDVDLRHDLAKERRRFERAEMLLAERLAERIHLGEREPERVVEARTACADGVVAFAQRSEQVRQDLQRPHDTLAHRESRREPRSADEHRGGPLHLGRKILRPQDELKDDQRRQPAREREQQDPALVSQSGRLRSPALVIIHTAGCAGRARCGSAPAPPRPG